MKFNTVLKLTTALLATTTVSAYESLKSKAGNFRIGVATDSSKFGNAGYSNAMANFNYMVAENACKMVGIQPQQGNYNFSSCDAHYNKAKELGMAFRGHCLVWHSMPPGWFEGLKGDALKNAMVDHINKVLKYYEGKIDTWDVVNEAIDDSSNGPQWKMRPSFLYQNIPDFVDLAFKTARAASSTTKLFYNDYNTEGIYGKSEAVFNFVKDMKTRGIPIDGVGLQYHVSTQSYPEYSKINDLIGRYCQLGLEVHITEMDVKSGGNAQAQAKVYSEALKACLSNSCCKAFLIWGVGDNDSWLGAGEAGLIFDGSYQPKAAYNALIETLGSSGGAAAGGAPAGGAPAAGGAPQDNNAGGAPQGAPQDNNAGGAPQGAPQDNNAGGAPQGAPQDNNFGGAPQGGAPQGAPQDNNFGGAPQGAPQDNNFGGAPQGGAPQGGFGDFGGFGGFGGGAPQGGAPQGGNDGGFPWGGNNNGGGFPWGGNNNNNNGGGWNPFGGNGGNGGGWNFPWGGNNGGNNFWQPSFFKKEDSAMTEPEAPVSNATADNELFAADVPLDNENCATLWAQCGGQGFNGPTCCSEGTCKVVNEYFSQCTKE